MTCRKLVRTVSTIHTLQHLQAENRATCLLGVLFVAGFCACHHAPSFAGILQGMFVMLGNNCSQHCGIAR
jgi:hypothetical protein